MTDIKLNEIYDDIIDYDIDDDDDTFDEDDSHDINIVNPKYTYSDPIVFFTPTKELLLFNRIDNYFKKECIRSNIDRMVEIINSKSQISLRILDWFITCYSKKNINIVLNDDDKKKCKDYNIRISYKAELKSYKKSYFDPFRRRKKFNYFYDNDDKSKFVLTTIGQLNFFKWAIVNNIIDYVEKNIDYITKAMNVSNKLNKDKKKQKKNTDIKLLTSSDSSSCYTRSGKLIKSSKKNKSVMNIKIEEKQNDDNKVIMLCFD